MKELVIVYIGMELTLMLVAASILVAATMH
jgi:hypothetical protein